MYGVVDVRWRDQQCRDDTVARQRRRPMRDGVTAETVAHQHRIVACMHRRIEGSDPLVQFWRGPSRCSTLSYPCSAAQSVCQWLGPLPPSPGTRSTREGVISRSWFMDSPCDAESCSARPVYATGVCGLKMNPRITPWGCGRSR